jgi:ribosomal protein L40E
MAVGVMISKFAFFGAVARYIAGEATPVGKDVTNYIVAETKGSFRDAATAIGEGLRAAKDDRKTQCPKCGSEQDADAAFCDQCGTSLSRRCGKCGAINDPNARFCDKCGTATDAGPPQDA